MQKLFFLLLLCLFSAFISDKNEKIESQLGGIQKEVLKWYQELNDFKKWDTDNNGFLDVAEKAALDARKKRNSPDIEEVIGCLKTERAEYAFCGDCGEDVRENSERFSLGYSQKRICRNC